MFPENKLKRDRGRDGVVSPKTHPPCIKLYIHTGARKSSDTRMMEQ